ncbi:MAG TPA: dienelactone hydrolase family protein [Acidimicrobiales bacterium]|nr:dienelactone hydrolase family protein [Acidimicrobiales bacterium]
MTWTETNTTDGPMRIFEAAPSGEARGAVIVIQEAFGVNDHITDVADRLAAKGWHAFAPDLFHRAGPNAVAPYDDFPKVMQLFEGLDDERVLSDVDVTLDVVHQRGFDESSIGVVGFCWGGRVTFLVALRRSLGAAVGFYGGGIVSGRFPQFPPLVGEAAALQTPWLGLFGDDDESIPVDDVEALRGALSDSAKVDQAIVRYADAGHGFHCDARPNNYAEAAAKDGWVRTLGWFDSHLKAV